MHLREQLFHVGKRSEPCWIERSVVKANYPLKRLSYTLSYSFTEVDK